MSDRWRGWIRQAEADLERARRSVAAQSNEFSEELDRMRRDGIRITTDMDAEGVVLAARPRWQT